jgi:N-acyl-D-amino-acid deacylase
MATTDSDQSRCDLLIEGGVLIDGSGVERVCADIAIRGDRISQVGDLKGMETNARIDATGLVVAPGFIDAHTHDDRAVMSTPDMTPKLSQGVTTVVTGNCGVSLAPLTNREPVPPLNLLGGREWYRYASMRAYMAEVEAAPPAINLAPLVGHTTLRAATMDNLDRPAGDEEIARMRGLSHLREAPAQLPKRGRCKEGARLAGLSYQFASGANVFIAGSYASPIA